MSVSSSPRATRAPGVYEIVWDGRDTAGKPVPAGTYRIVLETAQEFGNYAKRAAPIVCGATPATGSLLKSVNFENVTIQYGPKPTQA